MLWKIKVKQFILFFCSLIFSIIAFSFAKYGYLIFFSFAPFFYLLSIVNLKKRLAFSFLFGVIFHFCLMFWLSDVTYAGLFLLSLYFAVYYLLFSIFAGNNNNIFIKVVSFVVLEWLRCEIFLNYPFLSLGSSLGSLPSFIQLAAFGGIHLVSVWILFVNYLVVGIFCSAKKRTVLVVSLFCIFTVPLMVGKVRMNKEFLKSKKTIKTAVIQPNINPDMKWGYFTEAKQYKIIKSLATPLPDNLDVIMLPETVITSDFRLNENALLFLKDLVKDKSSYLLFGGIDNFNSNDKSFNSVFLVDNNLNVESIYQKINLVPFGEYIPFKEFLPHLSLLDPIGEGFNKGNALPYMKIKDNIFIAPLICFEDTLSGYVRKVSRQGIDLLVNITNDGWFQNRSGPVFHEVFSRFRAVENGLPVLRCANTGVSSYIDCFGRVQNVLKDDDGHSVNSKGVMVTDIMLKKYDKTVFSSFGYSWIFVLIFLAVIIEFKHNS